MTSLPEQFQAARQTQLDHQFSFLRACGDGMLERTGRVLALNLDLSRATAEHSSNTLRQLLAVRDPRDLFSIGAQSQRQLRTVFDYGHELFNIAAGLRGAALRSYPLEAAVTAPALAAPADVAAAVADSVEGVVSATEAATASAFEAAFESAAEPVIEQAGEQLTTAASAPDTAPAPVAVSAADIALDIDPVVTSDIAPPVAPTAIAKATSDILDVPLAPPHPVAASVPVDVDVEIELPKVAPVDATPPVEAPSNGGAKVTELRNGRGRKKQS